MAITNSQAVPFGLLAMYAEDMYSPEAANKLTPSFDERIEKLGWTPHAIITAEDTVSSLVKDKVRADRKSTRLNSSHT